MQNFLFVKTISFYHTVRISLSLRIHIRPMKYTSILIRTKSAILLLIFLPTLTAKAQDYWDKIPNLTSQCYSDNDDFGKKIQLLRSEVKGKLEMSKKALEEKARKITPEAQMAMAAKYQNMTPDQIIKMQNEMMEMTQLQTEFQQIASAMETRFNQLESDFRSEFGKRLGPIEEEYQKLPDGEGTPQWAIKKGEELMTQYNKEYESICDKYFTSPDAIFKTWLNDFNKFLLEKEVPFNQKMMKMEYGKYGLTPDESVAGLMAVDKYLERCASISNLRKQYP